MRILVTFALEREFAPWRRSRHFRRAESFAAPAWRARIGDVDVTVSLTGVGPARASEAAARLFSARTDLCISAGFLGALNGPYALGDVLAPHNVIARRGTATLVAPTNYILRRVAFACGAREIGRLYTADHPVSGAERSELASQADAVDMESFEILSAAARSGIPAVAVRVVSDTPANDLPFDFGGLLEGGEIKISRLLGQIARCPASLPRLVGLARRSRRAASSLASFLDAYVNALDSEAQSLRAQTEDPRTTAAGARADHPAPRPAAEQMR